MRPDLKVACYFAAAAIPLAVFTLVAPDHLNLTESQRGPAAGASIFLTVVVSGLGFRKALIGERLLSSQGKTARMLSLAGMLTGVVIFAVSCITYARAHKFDRISENGKALSMTDEPSTAYNLKGAKRVEFFDNEGHGFDVGLNSENAEDMKVGRNRMSAPDKNLPGKK